MGYYHLILLLASAIVAAHGQDDNTFTCGSEISGKQGELIISKQANWCNFTTTAGTKEILLSTNNLALSLNDSLTVISKDNTNVFVYKPPQDSGYLHIGGEFAEPSLRFFHYQTSNSSMRVRFFLGTDLSVNTDLNNNFKIKTIGATPALTVDFTKTLQEVVHIELNSGAAKATILGNHLMLSNDTAYAIYATATGGESIHIKTTIVTKNCSNTYNLADKSQEIVGPDHVNEPYLCVNLFKLNADDKHPEAHFDIDFSNFISLANESDELTIRDSAGRLLVDRLSENKYPGRMLSTRGRELVVTYRAPVIAKNQSPTGLRLTVVPKQYGGVVHESKTIATPTKEQVTYTLVPELGKFASIQGPPRLGEANLSLSDGGVEIARFGANSFLPPVITSARNSERLLLTYAGKSGAKFDFRSIESNCHALSSGTLGGYSVAGGKNGPCYWTLAADKDVKLTFERNDLTPNGCITIQPLTTSKPLFSRCNIKLDEVLPSFIVHQAYVNISLPSNSSEFIASLSDAPRKMTLLHNDTITSPGYPVAYPVMRGGQEALTLNATNKNYLISVADLDLRDGEKLQVGTQEISRQNRLPSGDIIVANSTVNVTVTWPAAPTDFSLRRGFKLLLTAFDYIHYPANDTTINNTSNSLIRISSPKQQHRIQYRILLNTTLPTGSQVILYDGRSSLGLATSLKSSNSFIGSSTSDTLMLVTKLKFPVSLKIDYSFKACNTSEDLVCDNSTRCVPRDFQCKGIFYCADGSDMKLGCNSTGPLPPLPHQDQNGIGGFTVFVLCILMLALGVLLSTYGPGVYKMVEDRFRSGQYNSFTSVE